MANSYSDNLFELIKSLSKSEKRFYKLYAARHTIGTKNNAILIFDYIAKMKVYDEALLKEKLKGNNFLNQFSITKNRIYEQILDSLNDYHQKNAVESALNNSLNGANILYEKGLYQQFKKRIEAVKRKAQKHKLNKVLFRIIQLEKALYEKQAYASMDKNEIETFIAGEVELLETLKVQSNLWQIKSLLFKKINELGTVRSKEDVMALELIIQPLNAIEYLAEDWESAYLYHHITSGYYFAIYDIDNCSKHLSILIQLYEANPDLIKQNPNRYFSIITNFIYCETKRSNFEIAQNYLNLLDKFKSDYTVNKDLEIKFFSSVGSLKLFLFIETGNYTEANALIKEIDLGIEQYEGKIGLMRSAYLNFQIGVAFLSQGAFKESLTYINKVLNEKSLLQRQDIYSFSLLLQLIIHFELKNYRFIPYILNTTKRFLKEKNRLYTFESIFLKVIQKIKDENLNRMDVEEVLASLTPEIEKLKEDKFEKTAFDYFDFSAWLKSKIENKTYLEIKKAG
ncbi:hypothetical protein DNU06_16770 [Putridiphycobacter roseus]|uniref:MalT-like TPR region domain-containing protein n=1 Tax=Putridiphycobacter roseus TaxID=2219161 RepID=A0A2W1NLU0_9FLAO|nr:hypothetical protein [Putridiphycobacter roseus]PZE15698.1 hypothetical protein DNU06_16770 [Putridiphycobacter roseus]